MPRFIFLLFVLPLVLGTSCRSSAPVEIRAETFPQLPITKNSQVLRNWGERRPAIGEKLFYGNYGGPGNLGGKPVDEMDETFRQHDLAYLTGLTLRDLRAADDTLRSQLATIPESGLDARGISYRDRAMRFFEKPISLWVGKPRDVKWGRRKMPRVILLD